ncbi:MAG: carboxypeptidase regulatory-like domain-containing protein [Acidobacteria bacterium]|nr:carboxypeptidase regulatory-like domain-containing protein [Acidobacteriota bacterium]MCB9398832.1 carboxypeptidase regulatory-like domain-containing protein [Acidobacteriota bacterium]
MKRLSVLLFALLPLHATTSIKGFIFSGDTRSVSGAKVLVYSGLGTFLVQRVDSDRNGTYHVNLSPGPYRLLILKKGYMPLVATFTLRGDHEEEVLSHQLVPDVSLGDNKSIKILKHILRSSNEPFRSEGLTLDPVVLPSRDFRGLSGTVSTRSQVGLVGGDEKTSNVQIDTFLGDRIAFTTQIERMEIEQDRLDLAYLHWEAGLNYSDGDWVLGVRGAQTAPDSLADTNPNRDRQVVWMEGQYTGNVAAHTQIRLERSDADLASQDFYSFQQSFEHEGGQGNLRHQIDADQIILKGETWHALDVASQWIRDEGRARSVEAQYSQMATSNGVWDTLSVNGRFHWQGWSNRLEINSEIGLANYANQARIDQNHLVSSHIGAFRLQGGYNLERDQTWVLQNDLVGDFARDPVMDHQVVGAQRQKVERSSLVAQWVPNATWKWALSTQLENRHLLESEMMWGGFLREDAQVQRWVTGISGEQKRWGSQWDVNLEKAASDQYELDRVELALKQKIYPFQQKDLWVSIELRMANQPRIPSWWQLNELPWDPSLNAATYEGSLRMMF